MQAVILAGGLGTRLRPLTESIPKPMVLIKGRPFLEYQIKMIANQGIKNFVICTGYLGEKIEEYFKDGQDFGVKISYSKESNPLGTGGALKNAQNLLEENFLVLYGDSFLDLDYKDLIEKFLLREKISATVAYENNPRIAANNIGINCDGEIISYDKKNEGDANCVEAGVHVLSKKVLDFMPENMVFSLEENVLPALIKEKQIFAYKTNKRYYDIGTFERLKIFENFILS